MSRPVGIKVHPFRVLSQSPSVSPNTLDSFGMSLVMSDGDCSLSKFAA